VAADRARRRREKHTSAKKGVIPSRGNGSPTWGIGLGLNKSWKWCCKGTTTKKIQNTGIELKGEGGNRGGSYVQGWDEGANAVLFGERLGGMEGETSFTNMIEENGEVVSPMFDGNRRALRGKVKWCVSGIRAQARRLE